jgi:hypothetical protein
MDHRSCVPLFLCQYLEVVGDVTKADFDSALLQATGAIILGLSIHILLTLVLPLWNNTTGMISVAHAMGYSLLPRIALIAWSFLKGEAGGYQIEGSTFLKINFGMMSWTAFSLLAGVGNSKISTKGMMPLVTTLWLCTYIQKVMYTHSSWCSV